MTGAWGIFIIALSVALNGFFAGVETGFTSARRVRLEHWARRGRRGAALAARMAGNRENAIVGAVVGNNVTVVAGTSVATAFAVHHIPESGETIAATVMAALNIVFGEITPRRRFVRVRSQCWCGVRGRSACCRGCCGPSDRWRWVRRAACSG